MQNKAFLIFVPFVFLACCLFTCFAFAQSGPLNDSVSPNDAPTTFENPRQEKLYQEVIVKLQGMKFSEESAFDDDELDDNADWFVVGGILTHKRTGEIEFNFNTFQGVEDVARRIVEFESGSYASKVPAWHVFDRFGGSREAVRALDKYAKDFQTVLVRREAEFNRQRQLAAQARSRVRRRGGC